MRNGRNSTITPMMNALFSSESTKAGMTVVSDRSSAFFGLAEPEASTISWSSSLRVLASMNFFNGFSVALSAWHWVMSPFR